MKGDFHSVRLFVINIAAFSLCTVLRNSPSLYFSLMDKISSLIVTQSNHQCLCDFLWVLKQKSLAEIYGQKKKQSRVFHVKTCIIYLFALIMPFFILLLFYHIYFLLSSSGTLLTEKKVSVCYVFMQRVNDWYDQMILRPLP